MRQMHRELERDRTLFIHLTLLPYIGATGELKTKPTQHSVKELRVDRYPARRDLRPLRLSRARRHARQDRAVLRRRAARGRAAGDRRHDLRACRWSSKRPAWATSSSSGWVCEPRPADLDGWRELVHRSRTVKDEVVDRRRRQVRRAAGRVHLGARGAPPRRLGAQSQAGRSSWIDSQRLEQADDDWRATARRPARHRRARRLRLPRRRGQDPRGAVCPRAQGAVPRAVPGHAGACASSLRGTCSTRRAELDRVQPVHPLPGDRPAARAARHRGQGRHDAAGRVPVPAAAGHASPAAAYDEPIVFERHRHRYEFNNTFRDALGDAGLVFSGTLAGRAAGRDRRAGRTTRSCSAASSIPS